MNPLLRGVLLDVDSTPVDSTYLNTLAWWAPLRMLRARKNFFDAAMTQV